MADTRTYIRVHDGIEDHPKIDPLSDKAFRLLVTTWAWCSRHTTDGRVPLKVWLKRGTSKARAELVDARLAEVYADHIVMHDYLEHQRSAALIAEKIDAKRRAGQLGNHNRWHRDTGTHDETCEFCVDSPPPSRNRSQVRSDSDRGGDSHPRSQTGRETSPETETETETEKKKGVTLGGKLPEANARATTPPPTRCARHANHDDPPPCRACAEARQAAEQWQRDHARTTALAIRACTWCDGDGWRWHPDGKRHGVIGERCDHTPARRLQPAGEPP
ncbi:hypothetical protein [Amycolatopsis sp. YIM 10]|uniref:hypothetical protein n=1 Tax=Amycolatopsis sp. YIM 10 TaxID=2653857 RepID=UPI00128FFAC1|nr:hypothetical protein [Amycolatopsis sp. YIM 10]QFU87854.1 hypothetical protein YIM_13340 [Amycolatopsis sp. YIM 10]QFU94833.1 hypothetical protein YIM_48540 [Amycolatopsis sp. YIM 10]